MNTKVFVEWNGNRNHTARDDISYKGQTNKCRGSMRFKSINQILICRNEDRNNCKSDRQICADRRPYWYRRICSPALFIISRDTCLASELLTIQKIPSGKKGAPIIAKISRCSGSRPFRPSSLAFISFCLYLLTISGTSVEARRKPMPSAMNTVKVRPCERPYVSSKINSNPVSD